MPMLIWASDESKVRWLPLLALAGSMAAALLCGGCSSEEEEDDPLSCSLNTSFTAPASPSTGKVTLQTSSTPCGELNLDVVFTNITDIFTVGFDLTYPVGTFVFDGYSEGPLLKQGSPSLAPSFVVSHDSASGRVSVWASRLGTTGTVSASGSIVMMTLSFRALQPGQGSIAFDLSSSPVQEQVLDDSSPPVAATATFTNGSNQASAF
jgi:hypothetical protein